ncbi:hypothetical protein BDN70DRAFT_900979 [Pholiota conissans]|uniref:Uncharacterized protein n=1 Tax=Pholiota conissans TaxID=109636 RepID=A0A9P5YM83_9AGAR|nr:hypothetical protein BDN70DRAFT_900979 [Pholiota conissans]
MSKTRSYYLGNKRYSNSVYYSKKLTEDNNPDLNLFQIITQTLVRKLGFYSSFGWPLETTVRGGGVLSSAKEKVVWNNIVIELSTNTGTLLPFHFFSSCEISGDNSSIVALGCQHLCPFLTMATAHLVTSAWNFILTYHSTWDILPIRLCTFIWTIGTPSECQYISHWYILNLLFHFPHIVIEFIIL